MTAPFDLDAARALILAERHWNESLRRPSAGAMRLADALEVVCVEVARLRAERDAANAKLARLIEMVRLIRSNMSEADRDISLIVYQDLDAALADATKATP